MGCSMTIETDNLEPTANDLVLDVRPIIEAGEEPFGKIMETVATLDGRSLLLIAPFEPTPLEGVLSSRGFTYRAQQFDEAEWRVRFTPGDDAGGDASGGETRGDADDGEAMPGKPADPAGSAGADHLPGASTTSDAGAAPDTSPFTISRRTTTPGAPGPPASAPSPATISRPSSTGSSGAARPSPAAMPMNPTMNVPPAWLPLGLLAAAAVGLVGFGIALLIVAPTAVRAPRSHDVVAAVHFGVLGFLSTAVVGALHQFGPVVGARPLRSIRAGAVSGPVFVLAAWTIPIGFATGNLLAVQVGGVVATLAIGVIAWNVSDALASTGKGAPIAGLRLAVFYLIATAAFGATYAFDLEHAWFLLLPRRVLAHAHLGLIGWIGLAYIAVAEKLWPMFLLAHRPSTRAGDNAVWFTAGGMPLLTIGLLVPSEPLTIAGAVLVLLGVGFHLASLGSVIRHRRRKLELLHGFVLGSAACLVVAVVLALILGLVPKGVLMRSRLLAAEVLALILWLTLAVVGHAHKIVPFIAWNRLRDRGIMTGPDGRPLLFGHLVNDTVSRVSLVLALAAAASGLIGALTLTAWVVRIAALLIIATSLTASANLVSGPIILIRRHDGTSRPDTKPAGSALVGSGS